MRRFRRVHRNPPLSIIMANPPLRMGVTLRKVLSAGRVTVHGVISERAEAITYKHVLNGKMYKHDFETPVSLIAAEIGGKRVVIVAGEHDDVWDDYPDEP